MIADSGTTLIYGPDTILNPMAQSYGGHTVNHSYIGESERRREDVEIGIY